MPIGAIAVSGRLSAAFAYVTMFFTFILVWIAIAYVIELIFNVFAAALIEGTAQALNITLTVPILNIPDPLELFSAALGYFNQLFGIGNTILWGFVETVFFGLAIVFGIPGAMFGSPNAFNRVKDFLMGVSDTARDKY